MKRILVVDDESLILYAFSAALKSDCVEVRTVANGTAALREIGGHFYDLCILDIQLPDMNGLDIMNILKEVSPATKIIIMTASEVDDEMLRSIKEKANLFLTKPFDIFRVKSCVERIMAESGDSYRDYKTLLQNLKSDRRLRKRKKMKKTITCSTFVAGGEAGGKNIKADSIDFSDTGMGIRTDCPLEPGWVLRIGNGTAYYTGTVRWSLTREEDGKYRAGVQFG